MLLAHKSVVAMAAERDCGYKLVDHPQYSPDLAPSDYFLVPQHEKNTWLWSSISTDDEVIYLPLRTVFWGSRWQLLYHGNQSAALHYTNVYTTHNLWKSLNIYIVISVGFKVSSIHQFNVMLQLKVNSFCVSLCSVFFNDLLTYRLPLSNWPYTVFTPDSRLGWTVDDIPQ